MGVRHASGRGAGGVAVAASLCLGGWLGAGAGPARADVIHFLDGSPPIEGRVVKDDGRTIVVEVENGRLTFPREDIDRIEKKEWKPPSERAAPTPPAPGATTGATSGAGAPGATRGTPAGPTAGSGTSPEPRAVTGGAAAPVGPSKPVIPAEARARAAAAIGPLEEALRDASPEARALALREIVAQGAPASLRIAELARDRRVPARERTELIGALGAFDDPEALIALGPLLVPDENGDVVEGAVSAAAGHEASAAALAPAFGRILTGHPSVVARAAAARALGVAGGASAVNTLLDELANPEPPIRDAAAAALRRIETPPAPAVLRVRSIVANPGPEEVRRAAVTVLAAWSPMSSQILEAARLDASAAVRSAAIAALAARTDSDSLDAAVSSLGERDPALLEAAATVVQVRRHAGAVGALVSATRYATGSALRAVHRALEAITGERRPPTFRAWNAWWETEGGKERFGR